MGSWRKNQSPSIYPSRQDWFWWALTHQNTSRQRFGPKCDGRRRDCEEQGDDLDECCASQMEAEEQPRPSRVQCQLNSEQGQGPLPNSTLPPYEPHGHGHRDIEHGPDSQSQPPLRLSYFFCSSLNRSSMIGVSSGRGMRFKSTILPSTTNSMNVVFVPRFSHRNTRQVAGKRARPDFLSQQAECG